MAKTNAPEKILVLGPAWVGDMVLAQSLFKVLKKDRPECQIDVAAPAWTLPLLERMPEVTKAISLPFKHGELAFWKRIHFSKSLRNQGYTQAIILTNSLKSALLPFAAKIPQRTSFLGEMRYGLINDIRPLDKTKLPRTVDRFVSLALPQTDVMLKNISNPQLSADKKNAIAALERLGKDKPKNKILGLCPGAEYGEAKRWPAEYYAEVANAALKNGWEVWLFGSDKDIPVTNRINGLCDHKCLDLGGKTKLGEAIDLMSLCDIFISNDSGLMHVAAALDKIVIAIFGSSDPKHTPPMSNKAIVEYLKLDCSPCFQRVCPKKNFIEKNKCLNEISPEIIINKLIPSLKDANCKS